MSYVFTKGVPMNRTMLSLLMAAALASPALAGAGVGPDQEIGPDRDGRVLVATDPAHPGTLAIGSAGYDTCWTNSVRLSTDGGSTWVQRCTPPGIADDDSTLESPTVGFDRQGTLLVAQPIYFGDGATVYVSRWDDGNQRWDGWYPAASGKYYYGYTLNTHLALDAGQASPYRDRLYVSFLDEGWKRSRLRVAYSTDDGHRWTSANATPVIPGEQMLEPGPLAVGADGALYLPYLSCAGERARNCRGLPAEVSVVRSTNGGQSWRAATAVAQAMISPGRTQGVFWHPHEFGALPGATAAVSVAPVAAVDNSTGPHRNRVYVVLTTYADKRLQVLITHSDDQGATWAAARPVSAGPRKADQFMPWVGVSPAGVVSVTWMDQRQQPTEAGYQPMVAFSTDGGASFSAPAALQQAVSQPATFVDLRHNASHTWLGDRLVSPFIGPDAAGAPSLRLGNATP